MPQVSAANSPAERAAQLVHMLACHQVEEACKSAMDQVRPHVVIPSRHSFFWPRIQPVLYMAAFTGREAWI